MEEKVYAGVLGKMIGVYLGRPVEGWQYEEIARRFGEVETYVNAACSAPLIVPDDDLSGTFAFLRAIEDTHGRAGAQSFADAWLNYVIENKTIFWWGGYGRSAEHTAYINLKNGLTPPASGAAATNGKSLSTQIGAQIFIDGISLACPDDPERAASIAHAAACVSHDGIAVSAACFLAAMESMAFSEKRLERLLEEGLRVVGDDALAALAEDVRAFCAKGGGWRAVRARVEHAYGYDRYYGACPIETNHAWLLASLLLGGNDFARALTICVSGGWDTDCNAGNVGCLNGVRLGLASIPKHLRVPIADRLYVVSADGGETVTDAVRETQKILRASAFLYGREPGVKEARFTFPYRGAAQGFTLCPFSGGEGGARAECGGAGLEIISESGRDVCVSTPVFRTDDAAADGAYACLASPSLYGTQTMHAELAALPGSNGEAALYALWRDSHGMLRRVEGAAVPISCACTALALCLPDTGGLSFLRAGVRFSPACGGMGARLLSFDWSGAPRALTYTCRSPEVLSTFVSSAECFERHRMHDFCLTASREPGIVTTGTRDWTDYCVTCTLAPGMHRRAGVVLRARGHRRFYAALLEGFDTLSIVQVENEKRTVLACAPFSYVENHGIPFSFSARGDMLEAVAGGVRLHAVANSRAGGGAGFFVEGGMLAASELCISAL